MNLQKIIQTVSDFVFNNRKVLLIVFSALTVLFAISASQLKVDAGFNKMVPLTHPYMKEYKAYENVFGGANRIAIAMTQKNGDIYNKEFMEKLKALTNEVMVLEGVDKPSVRSLFTPNTRFIEVVEEGFAGGNVVHATFQGTPEDLAIVRGNVQKSNEIGRTVANDATGALVAAGLLEFIPREGGKLDKLNYFEFSRKLEELRAKYESPERSVHIIGFAKAVGDIASGAKGVVTFFGVAFVITAVLMLWFVKDLKLTLIALIVAMMPVLWLLGTLPIIGFGIDPLSILVPFLIFSIGVSHAVQMTKTWEREVVHGLDSLAAAKASFASIFVPGTLALLTNVLGFAVIMLIPIDIVRELGITASLGVAWMIITNKMLLPILLSHLKLSPEALTREVKQESRVDGLWRAASRCVERPRAMLIVGIAAVVAVIGVIQAHGLKVGDYGQGVPELRQTSRYNQDNATIVDKFAIGVNTLGVVAQTKGVQGACTNYDVMTVIEKFDWYMQNVDGTQSVISLPGVARTINSGYNEGSLKWRQLPRDPQVLAQSVTPINTDTGLLNPDCSAMQVLINTTDQQGDTLRRLVTEAKNFAKEHNSDKVEFKLATGNMGVAAATNEAVDKARWEMNFAIFGALLIMCMLTFRSIRATLCILIPLALVSVLCEALMPALGIGLKVSTLPVIALGVGVGVDYGIYLFDRIEVHMEEGKTLAASFFDALRERGTAMIFTAVTMTLGVGTWAMSALKFQADMGILLAFMFFLNMLGAVFLLPAIAAFILKPLKLH
ncbi:MAG TPA: MMPL family transporter [Usitatibacteraceae bacterium]|nr:MMPL family transporter [Usitatibacteraceae bacterium]